MSTNFDVAASPSNSLPEPTLVLTVCSISQYLTLSLWRLDEHNDALKALFITSASLNSLYCIFWDIANDWSLSLPGLRPTLAFRKHQWWYYVASVEDAVLRFLWLGYVIFPHSYQNQHSSLISFMIAFLEVCRRGVWVRLPLSASSDTTTLLTLCPR